MKRTIVLFWIMIAGCISTVTAQKVLNEGTVTYDITIQTGSKEPQMADLLDGATTTVYVKGNQTRTDMVSALGNESTIYDGKSGKAVILKEYSGQKLMITLTKENWAEKNKKYNDLQFTLLDEQKTIAGYKCNKATSTLDGVPIVVYYCPEITVANKEYNTTFKNLPGLAMQYEIESGKLKFTYTASKINFDPIAAARFDFPKTGYRVMTYEENQQMKKGR